MDESSKPYFLYVLKESQSIVPIDFELAEKEYVYSDFYEILSWGAVPRDLKVQISRLYRRLVSINI